MFKELSRLLSSPTRLKIVKFFALQPESRFMSTTVAATVGVTRKAAEGELRALARAGLISRKTQGKKTWYAYDASHPYADALREFLEKTTLLSDKHITKAFKGITGISLIMAAGSFTNDTRSSLDLLVVARRPKHPGIPRAVRLIETNMALPIRYAVLETKEYRSRLEGNDRLLRDIFDFSHRVVAGKP